MLLPGLFGLLALRFPLLFPSALVLAALGDHFIPWALTLGIMGTLFHWARSESPPYHGWHSMLFLGLLSLFFVASIPSMDLEDLALLSLPLLWWLPLCRALRENSGGGSLWIPLGLALAVGLAVERSATGGTVASSFFTLLVAWYRQIPLLLRALSLLVGSSLLVEMSFVHPLPCLIVAAVLLLQIWDKWRWGRGECSLAFWSISTLILWAAILTQLSPTSVNAVQLVSLWGLTWWANRETCRLCLSTSRCRETVMSLMGARLPLLMGIALTMGPLHPLDLIWMSAFLMATEVSRSTSCRLVTAEMILESPCRKAWALDLQKKNNAS